MENIEKKLDSAEKDISYFEKMVEGADKLIKPWKLALILTNLFWAIVMAAFIMLAYLTPTEIDVQQNQGIPDQQQEQVVKGAS